MTRFLDCRLSPVGGGLAASVGICQATSLSDYRSLDLAKLTAAIDGQHVLIVAHGFNVDRADGIASLSNWEGLLQLPQGSAFVGVLWPGDSVWAHGLDYPAEPRVANEAGAMIAKFIATNFANAASLSFASHSLGARLVLATIKHLSSSAPRLLVRRLVLMAGAIDDNCLSTEFKDAAAGIETISVLSSMKDEVLSFCFPLGNFLAGIIAEGHPWWHAALGHCGPTSSRPRNVQAPYAIPDNWNFEHGDYLQIDAPPVPTLPIPTLVPPPGTPPPASAATGWQEAFSSAFASTRFR
jgi:hypothetical protein